MKIGDIVKRWKERRKEQRAPKLDQLKKQAARVKQRKLLAQQRRHRVREYLMKAGIPVEPEGLAKLLFKFSVFINLAISAYLIYHFSTSFGYTWQKVALIMGSVWTAAFILILFVLWVVFYLFIDLRIYKRKVSIEEVLADFLQLTAANIKAGMTIDRALWYAVRPRFGVLAREIEEVAKETIGGEDLKVALHKFASKYESRCSSAPSPCSLRAWTAAAR